MTLAEVLRTKGDGEILKIKDSASITDAATMLSEKKIGALLVINENNNIVGIISERDIVSGIGPHAADFQNLSVSALMTTNLVKCSPDDSVLEAMAMMTDRRIRHLPVFEDGNLTGFISVGDLVKSRISEFQIEADAMRQYITS